MNSRIFLLKGIALYFLSLGAAAGDITFPSISEGETPAWHHGKIVWHDLFTAQPDEAASFYASVFGWTMESHDLKGRKVFLAWSNGYPISSIVERERVDGDQQGGLWVAYASVRSVDESVKTSVNGGGRILVGRGHIPGRGDHAICMDPQGAIYGLIRLESGDPGEYFPNVGDFLWAQHYSADVEQAAEYYDLISRFEIVEDNRLENTKLFLLSSGGYARAGIGPAPEAVAPGKSDWIHFIRVDGIPETLARVADAGGAVVVAPQADLLGGRVAVISDPAGALVGLMEATSPTQETEVSQ
jgi:predicted enzyme related to lactoylglutathione lyase